jgi:hypothetical protein
MALAYAAISCRRDGAEQVARTDAGVMALAVSGRWLLWVTGPEHGELMMAAVDGGPHRLLANALRWPRGLWVAGGAAHVATARGLLRVPIEGGTARWLLRRPMEHIARDENGLYWVAPDAATIWRADSDGSAVRRLALASGRVTSLLADGRSVYWGSVDTRGGRIERADSDGSNVALWHRAEHAVLALAQLSGDVYWTSATALYRGRERLADGLHAPTSLVVGDGHAYFIEGADGARGASVVRALPLDGSAPVRSVSASIRAQALALAKGQLYWADGQRQVIERRMLL